METKVIKSICKRIIITGLILSLTVAGSGGQKVSAKTKDYINKVVNISVAKSVKIVGLGEATHGNVELQQLKKEVFQALVKNNGCRIFALEGDFGGCQKVNDYILGGESTAKNAVSQIGFSLYKTSQMEDLVQWMRDYNKKVADNKKLKFYGFDMQRYDNNKEILLQFLNRTDEKKAESVKESFKNLTDDTVYTQDVKLVKDALEPAQQLLTYLKDNKDEFVKKTDIKSYEVAYECAECIMQNVTLQSGEVNYSEARDKYMADKVQWIYQFEGKQLLFITGHNGHIARISVSPLYSTMGNYLADKYKKAYFAIGTDFNKGKVRVVNSNNEVKQIYFENTNSLTDLVKDLKGNQFYIDIEKADKNKKLSKIFHSSEKMMVIGAGFDEWQLFSKNYYTLNEVPAVSYNGLIILKEVTPTTVDGD